MSAPPRVVVGDALLDRDVDGAVDRVCPDAPAPVVDVDSRARPGGAGLAAVLCRRTGADVTLVAAGRRRRRRSARRRCSRGRRRRRRAGHDGRPGARSASARGHDSLRVDRDGGPPSPCRSRRRRGRRWTRPTPCSCPTTAAASRRRRLRTLLHRRPRPAAGGVGPAPARRRPVPGCPWSPRTPPRRRARVRQPGPPRRRRRPASAAPVAARAVAVTRRRGGRVGRDDRGAAAVVPAVPASGGDTCGAGDRFAALRRSPRLAHGDGAVSDAVARAPGGRRRRRRRGGRGARSAADHRSPTADGRRRARGARRRRHRRRHRRLLRPAARRPRRACSRPPAARRLPRGLPQLRRVGAPAQGTGPAAVTPGRTGPACCSGAGVRRRRRRLRRGRPARGPAPPAARRVGQGRRLRGRPTCPRPTLVRSWGGRVVVPTSPVPVRPVDDRRPAVHPDGGTS